MKRVFIFVSAFIFSCLLWTGSSRKIKCFLNPDLSIPSNINTNVVHVISEGDKDNIHYIWSSYKFPSVIVARTLKNTSVLINTTKLILFEDDAIIFKDGNPLESVGLTFDKLWALNYTKDLSQITDSIAVEELGMVDLLWSDINETLKCSDTFAHGKLKARNDESLFSKNGTFEIQFSVSANQEISSEYPHLVFTGNSTLLKLVFNNLYSNQSKVRYGIRVSVFSSLQDVCSKDNWEKIITQSINDELSPGVFSDVEILAPCSKEETGSAFVSWRPVAYIGQKPIVANSSDVTMMQDPQVVADVSILSIAELYFSKNYDMSSFNLTFGTPGDGFYPSTLYTDWSVMLGTGRMVEVPLSASVIIFASLGLGLVLLFSIAGMIYIVFKKCKERDDDLLLN